jgi:dTDP-D-glucose 4,6-dehydratase
VLGWAPRVELEEGLRLTIEYFRQSQQAVERGARG